VTRLHKLRGRFRWSVSYYVTGEFPGGVRLEASSSIQPYLDVEPSSSIPEIHNTLVEPHPPVLEPVIPRLRPAQRLRTKPHGNAKDSVVPFLLCDIEEGVSHTPAASYTQGDTIPFGIELRYGPRVSADDP
jgi:hypothetical protein